MSPSTGLAIQVSGIVQGVGFRPFVYQLAQKYHLTGWVRNSSAGVEIEIEGGPSQLDSFLQELRNSPPPLSRIDTFEVTPLKANGYTSFQILESHNREGDFIPISADIAICEECREELFNPHDRRFRYPFINCTNCGPRFTIIQNIPYDRPNTTMSGFSLCPACQYEYDNPTNRRFHAQPVACPTCGPQIWLEEDNSRKSTGETALQSARTLLAGGGILALKGLGGFHLVCDATNPVAVTELRRRKKRSLKPFALMAFDLEAVREHCEFSPAESNLISSPQHPIVLLRKKFSYVPDDVAPGQTHLGIMLPYTPLHLLLLEPEPKFPSIFVMTSGNLSEEPIAYKDSDARLQLSGLADAFLLHDRPIHMRVDDSVVRVFQNNLYPLRRARGYAPDAIRLQSEIQPVLAVGGELKNTFCLTRGKYAFISHHIGDMENFETYQSFEQGIDHFRTLFRIDPRALACDAHPDYLATRYAQEYSRANQLPLYPIQHHHAHLAACLADNDWDSNEPVMGFLYDGTGYGEDGAIWGGEIFTGGFRGFERKAHLEYVPLPGGDITVKKPARMALSHLWSAGVHWDDDSPPNRHLCYEEKLALRLQLEKRLNSPLTSSMGRLFDAIAALIGVRQEVSYEGQAAIELESVADSQEHDFYPLPVENGVIQISPLINSLMSDRNNGVPIPVLSARFHNSVARMTLETAINIRKEMGINVVALSGGVWQNMRLLRDTVQSLKQDRFKVLVHHQVPTNDGGISLGQAIIVSRRISDSITSFSQ